MIRQTQRAKSKKFDFFSDSLDRFRINNPAMIPSITRANLSSLWLMAI